MPDDSSRPMGDWVAAWQQFERVGALALLVAAFVAAGVVSGIVVVVFGTDERLTFLIAAPLIVLASTVMLMRHQRQ